MFPVGALLKIFAIKTRLRVRVGDLQTPVNILASPEFLRNRKEGLWGTVGHPVKDHPNAWWVYDAEGCYAPYWYSEFEPLTDDEQREMFGDVFNP